MNRLAALPTKDLTSRNPLIAVLLVKLLQQSYTLSDWDVEKQFCLIIKSMIINHTCHTCLYIHSFTYISTCEKHVQPQLPAWCVCWLSSLTSSCRPSKWGHASSTARPCHRRLLSSSSPSSGSKTCLPGGDGNWWETLRLTQIVPSWLFSIFMHIHLTPVISCNIL